jgi:glycine/D-amino acid oxidase-like deaminating enzyme
MSDLPARADVVIIGGGGHGLGLAAQVHHYFKQVDAVVQPF